MDVTDYLSAIIVGAVVGTLGRLVLPGRQRVGIITTFVIGVGAAFLGLFLAHLFGVDDRAGIKVWKVRWDWIVLAFQVGLAVIGVGIANVLTYTRLSEGTSTRKRSSRRRTRTS